jgi:hypothetical protein
MLLNFTKELLVEVKVTFVYDEAARKWEANVTGVADPIEARQAFSAVVITCQALDESLLGQTLVEADGDGFKITPAVLAPKGWDKV